MVNYGTAVLNITSVTSNNPVFTVESFPSTVQPNQFGYAKVKFTPTTANTVYNAQLTVNNSDSNLVIALNGVCGQINGITPISGEIPSVFSLKQNFPNPFNPVTNIEFAVPVSSNVKIAVYDITGREIAILVNSNMRPGIYRIDWNAADMPSGAYFYKLTTGNFTETRRMILVK
jgi:hypothetical protein